MRFRDRFKKLTKKKTPSSGSSIQTGAQQGQANATTQKPTEIEDIPISELWNVAYEKLREEDGALIAEYERILQCSPAAGSTMKDQLRIMLENKMKDINARVSRFGKTEAPATETVSKIMGLANDYVRSAARANSYTSIAWAGVGFILPVSEAMMAASAFRFILILALAFDQSVPTKSLSGESNRRHCISYFAKCHAGRHL